MDKIESLENRVQQLEKTTTILMTQLKAINEKLQAIIDGQQRLADSSISVATCEMRSDVIRKDLNDLFKAHDRLKYEFRDHQKSHADNARKTLFGVAVGSISTVVIFILNNLLGGAS